MSTVIGIECAGGVVLAGDRTETRGGSITSTSKDRVFDLGRVGAAVVGASGGIDEFERRLDAERREYETDRGSLRIDALERIASDLASELDVSALVAGLDDDGAARLRQVSADGGTIDDPTAALGSGAELAYGGLEGVDADASLDEAAEAAREIMATVAERDTETGEETDLYRLSSGSDGGN
jgi:proteasome beta subunit